jgi:hypothetical protein
VSWLGARDAPLSGHAASRTALGSKSPGFSSGFEIPFPTPRPGAETSEAAARCPCQALQHRPALRLPRQSTARPEPPESVANRSSSVPSKCATDLAEFHELRDLVMSSRDPIGADDPQNDPTSVRRTGAGTAAICVRLRDATPRVSSGSLSVPSAISSKRATSRRFRISLTRQASSAGLERPISGRGHAGSEIRAFPTSSLSRRRHKLGGNDGRAWTRFRSTSGLRKQIRPWP